VNKEFEEKKADLKVKVEVIDGKFGIKVFLQCNN
jgi:hypothetical protein